MSDICNYRRFYVEGSIFFQVKWFYHHNC